MARKGLYRIVHIATLIKMFKERKNYLSSPQNWTDHWEKLELKLMENSKTDLFERIRTKIFAQCWSREAYSWALWKMNSLDGLGVRIKTNISDLYEGLPQTFRAKFPLEEVFKEVEYLSEEAIKDRIGELIKEHDIRHKTVREMYFLKRRAFEYEKEARLIVPNLAWMHDFHKETLGHKSFLTYQCDPGSYIESIYFDSKVDPYLFDVFSEIIRGFKFKGLIGRSAIDAKPDVIEIGENE